MEKRSKLNRCDGDCEIQNKKELSDFTKTLLAMPFVERTNKHVVLTTVKEDYRII
jgi:hypothetical protein